MFRQAVSCARSVHALLAVAAGSAMLASPAAFGQFVQGDMYFASVIVPRVGSACGGPAVLRFPQGSWVGTLVGTPIAGFNGRMAYDRTRGVLILGNSDLSLETMNSSGVHGPLAPAGTAQVFAPAGDGRIFFWKSGSTQVRYFDANNVQHTLMDNTGAQPYNFPIGADFMAYDAGTNALFIASETATDFTQVTKLPLNAAGTAVTSAITVVTFDASPGFNTEKVVGISKGPNGNLLLTIDDNGGGEVGRMQLINPVTNAQQLFATSNYFGVGGEVAGTFVPALNAAVVYDSLGGQFRAYSQGGHGEGSTVAVAALANGCFAGAGSQMLVIDAPPVTPSCPADVGTTGGVAGHDGVLNNNDFVVFINMFFTGDPGADRGSTGGVHASDGHLDNNDFIVFIDQFFAGC